MTSNSAEHTTDPVTRITDPRIPVAGSGRNVPVAPVFLNFTLCVKYEKISY